MKSSSFRRTCRRATENFENLHAGEAKPRGPYERSLPPENTRCDYELGPQENLHSDVIKTYVEYGLGVGIIASMAYDPTRDKTLSLIRCDGLFRPSTSSIAVRQGKPLRKYVYRFIELCSPDLNETVVRKSQSKT